MEETGGVGWANTGRMWEHLWLQEPGGRLGDVVGDVEGSADGWRGMC